MPAHHYHDVIMSLDKDAALVAAVRDADAGGTLHKALEDAFGASFDRVYLDGNPPFLHVFGRYDGGENPGLFDRCVGRGEENRRLLADRLKLEAGDRCQTAR